MSILEVKQLLSTGFLSSEGSRLQLIDTEATYQTDATRMRLFKLPGNVMVLTWLDRVTGQVRIFVDADLVRCDDRVVLEGGMEIAPAEWN